MGHPFTPGVEARCIRGLCAFLGERVRRLPHSLPFLFSLKAAEIVGVWLWGVGKEKGEWAKAGQAPREEGRGGGWFLQGTLYLRWKWALTLGAEIWTNVWEDNWGIASPGGGGNITFQSPLTEQSASTSSAESLQYIELSKGTVRGGGWGVQVTSK